MFAAHPAQTHHIQLEMACYRDVKIMVRGRHRQSIIVCVDFRGSRVVNLNQPDLGPTQTTLLLALTWIANHVILPDHRERFDEVVRGTYVVYVNGDKVSPADFTRTVLNSGDRLIIA